MSTEEKSYSEGYRQAVLDCARCLCLADHVGDVHSNIQLVWKAAGLPDGGPPTDENTGAIDDERLGTMGARECYEIEPHEHGREDLLISLVAAACSRHPHEFRVDPEALADVLGVRIQRSVDGEHARIDPSTLPEWFEDTYAPEGEIEWEP